MNPEQTAIDHFHEKYDLERNTKPTKVSGEEAGLRIALIAEEFNEVIHAISKEDLVNLAKELADLLVVTYGTAVTYGIDLEQVFWEVHRANMTKDGDFNEQGKLQKGPNYIAPNIQRIIDEQSI